MHLISARLWKLRGLGSGVQRENSGWALTSAGTFVRTAALVLVSWRNLHLNSELIFKKYALDSFRPESRVLQIGPDKVPSTYQTLVGIDTIEWHTIDI